MHREDCLADYRLLWLRPTLFEFMLKARKVLLAGDWWLFLTRCHVSIQRCRAIEAVAAQLSCYPVQCAKTSSWQLELAGRISGAAEVSHTEVQFLLKEVPWRLIQERFPLCVYDLVALRFGGLKDFVFRYKWIPATSMFFTFNCVAYSMERELWIEDELSFYERKLPAIFGATPIK